MAATARSGSLQSLGGGFAASSRIMANGGCR